LFQTPTVTKAAPVDTSASFFVSAIELEQEQQERETEVVRTPSTPLDDKDTATFTIPGVVTSPARANGLPRENSGPTIRSAGLSSGSAKKGKKLGATRVVATENFDALYTAKEEADKRQTEKKERAAAEVASIAALSTVSASEASASLSPKEEARVSTAPYDWMDRSKTAISATGGGVVPIATKTASSATSAKKSPSPSLSSSSDSATSRFAGSKAISSDQFFKTESTDQERAASGQRATRFEGQSAISSDMWFGNSTSPSARDPASEDMATKIEQQFRDDLSVFTQTIGSGTQKIASIASSYLHQFNG